MAKLPALQFYPGDWHKDPGIQCLSLEEKGAWLELLFLMHESSRRGYLEINGLGIDEETVGKLLGIHGNKWKKIKRKLEVTGVASIEENTGILFNRRMVRDEETRQKCIVVGKLGGNPNFQKGKPNPYYKDNPQDNPQDKRKIRSSSSSSSSSSYLGMGEDPAPTDDSIISEFGEEVFEYYNAVCNDYILASGKTYKNLSAFMRNWIRKDIAERKGFYFPKDKPGFVPHTGASTYEKNMEFLNQRRLKNGQEPIGQMFDEIVVDKKEPGVITTSARHVALLPGGDIKPGRS